MGRGSALASSSGVAQAEARHQGSAGQVTSGVEPAARSRQCEPGTVLLGLLDHPLHGGRPGVEGEVEGRPVDRQQHLAAQLEMGAHGLRRIHVYVGPAHVVGTDRQDRQVEGTEPLPELGERRGVAAVAAEEHPVPRTGDHPRGPQGGVVGERATGEVPRLGAGQGDPAELVRLVPVQLDHERGRHPPAAQVGADAERDHEHRRLGRAGEDVDRGDVEMVVVVVGDQHDIDAGQLGQRDRHRVAAAGTDRRRGRDPVAPHRVGQHPHAVDLEQHGGVAQPGRREVGRLLGEPRSLERDGGPGSATAALGDELRGDRGPGAALDHRCRQPVVEEPVSPLRGAADVLVGLSGPQGAAYASGRAGHGSHQRCHPRRGRRRGRRGQAGADGSRLQSP